MQLLLLSVGFSEEKIWEMLRVNVINRAWQVEEKIRGEKLEKSSRYWAVTIWERYTGAQDLQTKRGLKVSETGLTSTKGFSFRTRRGNQKIAYKSHWFPQTFFSNVIFWINCLEYHYKLLNDFQNTTSLRFYESFNKKPGYPTMLKIYISTMYVITGKINKINDDE